MHHLRLLLFSLLCCTGWWSNAQDVAHFTLFDQSPLTTNPAYTGDYEGTARIGGHFRDQNFTFSPNTFISQAFYIDAPLFIVRKRDWISAGALMFGDKAGSVGQQTNAFLFSVAYHMSLDKKSKNILTLGLQGGQINRNIDDEEAKLGASIQSGQDPVPLGLSGGGVSLTNARAVDASGFDLSAGLLLKSQMNKKSKMHLGLVVRHILQPDFELVQGMSTTDQQYDLRLTFHGGFETELNDKFTLAPKLLFNQRVDSEVAIQAWMHHKLKKKKPSTPPKTQKLQYGLGYRVGDALQVLLGYQTDALQFSLGYDVTLSDLSQGSVNNGTFGAIEFGANYILKIYKEPDLQPVILCPRL